MSIEKCIKLAYWFAKKCTEHNIPLEWAQTEQEWDNILADLIDAQNRKS